MRDWSYVLKDRGMESGTGKRKTIKNFKKNKILYTNKSYIMGCFFSAPSTTKDDPTTFTSVVTTSPSGLKRQVTITLVAAEKEDVLVAKLGLFHVIHGTRVALDMNTLSVIGYINDAEELVKEATDAVKAECAKHDLAFSS